MKMLRIVDISNGDIAEYNEKTVSLLLERNAARYFMPEDVTLGADANDEQKLALQNAILFNSGRATVNSPIFTDEDVNKVIAAKDDQIEKLEKHCERLEEEIKALTAALEMYEEKASQSTLEETAEETAEEIAEEIAEETLEETLEETAEADKQALEALTIPALKAFAESEKMTITKKKKDDIIKEIVSQLN
jgi:SNF2 family DNA or RNA helicase